MRLNASQKVAIGFGLMMLVVIGVIAPWAEEVGGTTEVLLGAWAPVWNPPSAQAVIDLSRLAIEGLLVFCVTALCVWMLRD